MQTVKSKQLNLKTQYWKNPATTIFPTCQGLEAKLSALPDYKQGTPGSVPKLLADELCLLTKSRGALEPSLWMCFPAVWTYNAEHISVVCSLWNEESLEATCLSK